MSRTLLLTGFEPFLDVAVNPSGRLARALDGEELSGGLRARGLELPVSFDRGPAALREAADALGGDLAAIVSLGVHRGRQFRLERLARARFESAQRDNDGRLGEAIQLAGPAERRARPDLEAQERGLQLAGAAETTISSDAGGYLCERIFREGLEIGEERDIEAVFLHVPPVEAVSVEEQLEVLRAWLNRREP